MSLVDNCFKPPSKPKEDEKFDTSDEELDKFLSEVAGLKLIKRCSNVLSPNSLLCRTFHSLTVPLTFRLPEISNTKSIVCVLLLV